MVVGRFVVIEHPLDDFAEELGSGLCDPVFVSLSVGAGADAVADSHAFGSFVVR